MYLLLKERKQTLNPHHIHVITLFSPAQEMFTRPHHDANDSRLFRGGNLVRACGLQETSS